LGREFQLAREIQRTFIPSSLPETPGWDKAVFWRTAYEVSGDFYDMFMLDNDQLAIVVADVADKGMPAALFMTLVRTLLRATVQQIDSPASVLEHINQVVLPDAKNGMFITLVYGILNIKSGIFSYANAGHNPPLLFSASSGEINRLSRGGMALGVIEEFDMIGRSVPINHGDLLLFYSDGITESFSPQESMFGEDRMIEILAALEEGETGSLPVTAEELVDRISSAVESFTKSAPPSDDQTLIAIRRVFE
jgi:serine phosphatase RsbU (regulator of sigma subunit)